MLTDAQVEKIVNVVVEKVLKPKFIELDMDASGEWLATTRGDKNTIIGPAYTEQLVKGRGPGKRPPIAPIEKWVEAKLGLSGRQATSAAFAISASMAEKGTTWFRKGGSDLLEILESKEVYDLFVNTYALEVKATLADNFRRALKGN
jgi:hypothetical protein